MTQKLQAYIVRRIKALKDQGKSTYQIIEELGAVSDFGHYQRPELRKMLGI
jgi:hypothetical protein